MRRAALVLPLSVLALAGCAAPVADDTSGDAAPTGTSALSGTVSVYAAASLTETFDLLEADFESANPGVDVVMNYGGSSTLAEQIVQGAPADVFAAANPATMQTVADAGLADPSAVFVTNTLEIVVPAGNPAGVTGLEDLARPELVIALCAAEVPCGAASEQLLAAEGVTAAPDTLEQDVKAVLTKVSLGEVDAALVYRTDVVAAGDTVEGIEVDAAATVVNDYPIATLTASENPDAAAAFVAFVRSADARAVFDEAGFGDAR